MSLTINIIGNIAACLTTISFLPQVIRIIKTKQTSDISLTMYIIFCIGLLLWLVYGVVIQAQPLIFANSITLMLAVIILLFKLKYG